jgi:hypothetical protein
MADSAYRGRRAATIENNYLRVTVLVEGGHIAEIFSKEAGVNPLWTPPWPSIEPSDYDPARHPEFGSNAESRLLAGIMGHNLCLDIFGGPSEEEADAGLTVHGEGSIAAYRVEREGARLTMQACLPMAQLDFQRTLELQDRAVRIRERVTNRAPSDRPIAWTQHVTLGPPFLEKGWTEFRASATQSKVYETEFGDAMYLVPGAEFDWPMAPCKDGGVEDLRVFNRAAISGAFTTHLMQPADGRAFFTVFHPGLRLALGYAWNAADFPWLGIWEENYSRKQPPWNGQTLARGMEFGASPMPETRRQMIDRGKLFGVPAYRWLPAKATAEVEYMAMAWPTTAVPESLP